MLTSLRPRRSTSVLTLAALCVAAAAAYAVHVRRTPAPGSTPPTPPARPAEQVTFERDGVRGRLELQDAQTLGEATAFRPAVALLTLEDARTGEPLRGARPRVWLSRAEEGAALDEAACRGRIKTYLGGLLSAQADVDLNAAWLLVMNDDNTIAVLNPHVAFSRTKLHSLVALPGRAADWALAPDGRALFVSVPRTGELAVVDTRRFLATARIDVGPGAGRLVASADGTRLFVQTESRWVAVDPAARSVLGGVDVAGGGSALALARGGAEAFVAAAGAAHVQVVDAVTLAPLARIPVGTGVTALAASDASGVVLAAAADALQVLDVEGRRVAGTLRVAAEVDALRFDPSGRWAFALHRARGAISVIDAASRTVRAVIDGLGQPDALTFTRDYLYARDTQRPRLWLMRLDALLEAGTPGVSEVQVGQAADAAPPALAAPFTPVTEGDGVIVAAPADRALYFYTEGMMAPLGTLRNNGRVPRAVLLLDRSLREVQPGQYRAEAQLGAAGVHDVAVLLDTPRVGTCTRVSVAAPASGPGSEDRPRVVAAFRGAAPVGRAGSPLELTLDVIDQRGAPVPATELQLLALKSPGGWRWRGAAAAAAEGGVRVVIPEPPAGRLQLLVAAPGRGLDFSQARPLEVGVRSGAPVAEVAP